METPDKTHFQVAPLQEAMLDACAEIAATAPDPWSRAGLASALADNQAHPCFVLLAGSGGPVVGFACFSLVCNLSDLMLLVIHPQWRRQGAALALLQHSFAVLAAAGCVQCLLEVRASNSGAIALYQRLGFQNMGVRPHMYQNPPEDGLLMAKNL